MEQSEMKKPGVDILALPTFFYIRERKNWATFININLTRETEMPQPPSLVGTDILASPVISHTRERQNWAAFININIKNTLPSVLVVIITIGVVVAALKKKRRDL